MTECEHKTGKCIESGPGYDLWLCEWGCGHITIVTEDGKEQTLTELVAERDELRADRVAKIAQWHVVGERLMELSREVDTLRAALEKEEIECSVNETVLQYVKEDYDELRAALMAIVDAAKNYRDVDAEILAAVRLLEGV